MPEKQELADFQDALLELLASGQSQNKVLEALKTDPRFHCYREYVNQFDPDMVAVACELMCKWAIRKDSEGEPHAAP